MAAKSTEEIARLLAKVRFRRRFIGADDQHVWQVLGKLQEEYCNLLDAQKERHEALMEDRQKTIDEQKAEIKKLREQLGEAGDENAEKEE